MGNLHWATRLVIVVFVSLCVRALIVSLALGNTQYRNVYALLWIASAPLGWPLGTLSTPYDQAEEQTFGTAGPALSGFLFGRRGQQARPPVRTSGRERAAQHHVVIALLSWVAVTLSATLITAVIRKCELQSHDDEEERLLPAQL